MKTKEELNALKEKVEALNKKLAELDEDELKQVTGGLSHDYIIIDPTVNIYPDIDINTDKIIYMDVDTIPDHHE